MPPVVRGVLVEVGENTPVSGTPAVGGWPFAQLLNRSAVSLKKCGVHFEYGSFRVVFTGYCVDRLVRCFGVSTVKDFPGLGDSIRVGELKPIIEIVAVRFIWITVIGIEEADRHARIR